MFSNDLIFGFIVFGAAVVVNRLLAERALRRLSAEQKAQLIDSFSKNRIFHVVTTILLMVVYLIAYRVWPQSTAAIVSVVLILLMVLALGNLVFSYLKMKRLSLPRSFVSSFLVRSLVYYAGLLLLIVIIGTKIFPG